MYRYCHCKIQTGFTFLVPARPGSPGQRAVKCVCVCVCVCVSDFEFKTLVSAIGKVTLCVCSQSKEKSQSKNSAQTPSVTTGESASPGYKSPPTLSAVSAVVATTAAKSTAGKFTTANFIETTIQPSPANFGSVGGGALH